MLNKKKIWIFTLFPNQFNFFFSEGVIARCHDYFDIKLVNIRDYSDNKYKSVDDAPYGGGPGMVIRPDICFEALKLEVFRTLNIDENTWNAKENSSPRMIYVCPTGKRWSAQEAKNMSKELSTDQPLVFWCGRYEGIDERFIERFIHERYSIGDYVLSGGELAVQVMLDSAMRFFEGILGNSASYREDSFEDGMLSAPCFTRPKNFMGMDVPSVLLEGNHALIKKFQLEKAQEITKLRRPDLDKK